MIVEVIGSSGAGKTTVATMLARRRETLGDVVLASDLIVDRPGRRWVRDPKAVNLLADVTCLPPFLRERQRYRDLMRFARTRLRSAPSRFARYNYLREIVRDLGKRELARRVGPGSIVLLDEGPLLTAYHLFVYNDAPFTTADVERFARLVPVPDRVVYVTAPIEVLVDRAMGRSDRRRELASASRREIQRRIARAIEVFDALVASPQIRDRTLVVENPDMSGVGLEAAVAQVASLLDRAIADGPPKEGAVRHPEQMGRRWGR
jgi:thymidylate kinase